VIGKAASQIWRCELPWMRRPKTPILAFKPLKDGVESQKMLTMKQLEAVSECVQMCP
jgi:hypothetical protein